MAMEDEGQAKEIPLATAQPVHAHLGSWWYRQSHWSDMSGKVQFVTLFGAVCYPFGISAYQRVSAMYQES